MTPERTLQDAAPPYVSSRGESIWNYAPYSIVKYGCIFYAFAALPDLRTVALSTMFVSGLKYRTHVSTQ